MSQETIEFIKLILGSGGLLAIGVIFFRTGKIVEKIDGIEKRLEKLESNIPNLTIAVTRIEVRLEERALNKPEVSQKSS